MSATIPRVASALTKFILNSATLESTVSKSFALATEARNVTVYPTGLRWEASDGIFSLNFYTSFAIDQIELPALVIYCTGSNSKPDTPGIDESNVTLSLEYNIDISSDYDSSAIMMEQVARWIDDLLDPVCCVGIGMEEADPLMIVSDVIVNRSSTTVDSEKRVRSIQWELVINSSI